VPTREAVRQRLQLGEEYDEWLAELDRLGPPDPPLIPPTQEDTGCLLERLGFAAEDARDAIASRIQPDDHPELWWLLERCYHAVIRGLQPDAPRWVIPRLPDELGARGRFFQLHALLPAVSPLRDWHARRGIADDVSWATLQDLGRGVAIHRATHGVGGLDKAFWLTHHFHGELFELGRLQFELQRDGLGLHIPATGPLTPQACDDSLALARSFLAEHFPDPARGRVVCKSWLLDEQLLDYLPADSNIVRFQRRFTLDPDAIVDDHEPLRFVFQRVPADLGELPRDTTLQRALLDHLERGGRWRIRTGWFPWEPLPS
jgi:GNAT-like C-terminal domain/N-acyltransferase N-terminal domain